MKLMDFRAAPAILLFLTPGAAPAAPKYSQDVTGWKEITPPPETRKQAREEWFREANAGFFEWNVSARTGRPTAVIDEDETGRTFVKPPFPTAAGKFNSGAVFAQVPDGWLAGLREDDKGEDGDAALYWFSKDGKKSYKISDHRVTDFIPFAGAPHAIEGRKKGGATEGSLIRLARPKPGAPWEAAEVVRLPAMPRTVCADKKGALVITLSNALVSVGPDGAVRTLLADAPWGALYPNTSALTPDGWRLYIGMRQYVGVYDFKTGKLGFLLPSADFREKWEAEERGDEDDKRRRPRTR